MYVYDITMRYMLWDIYYEIWYAVSRSLCKGGVKFRIISFVYVRMYFFSHESSIFKNESFEKYKNKVKRKYKYNFFSLKNIISLKFWKMSKKIFFERTEKKKILRKKILNARSLNEIAVSSIMEDLNGNFAN